MVRSIGLPEIVLLAIGVVFARMLYTSIRDFPRRGSGLFSLMWYGSIAGAIVGFLLRPVVSVVGQLPFVTVITRGGYLGGLDIALKGAAEASFNYMIAGAIIGGLGLAVVVRTSVPAMPLVQPANLPSASRAESSCFCIKCGKALSEEAEFCGGCGTKRAST